MSGFSKRQKLEPDDYYTSPEGYLVFTEKYATVAKMAADTALTDLTKEKLKALAKLDFQLRHWHIEQNAPFLFRAQNRV